MDRYGAGKDTSRAYCQEEDIPRWNELKIMELYVCVGVDFVLLPLRTNSSLSIFLAM